MCRVVAYLGEQIPLSALLYDSESSLTHQVYAPNMMDRLNLAGFGFAAWDPDTLHASEPFFYRSPQLPMYDLNLKRLSRKVNTSCAIGHIRGASYFPGQTPGRVHQDNLHPFFTPRNSIAFAHNGGLSRFDQMKFALIEHMKPEIAAGIGGSTDSEWIYALMLSQLEGGLVEVHDIVAAVIKTLQILKAVRDDFGIDTASGVNIFIANGDWLIATRYTYDFGCYPAKLAQHYLNFHSLWYTLGERFGLHDAEWGMRSSNDHRSLLVASEPLSKDTSTWIEVPEYTLIAAHKAKDGGVTLDVHDLDF